MARLLADGGPKSGVSFNMQNFNSADCSGTAWNVDANFEYLNFPIAPRSAGTPSWESCVDVQNGGSRADSHCIMTTAVPQYRGRMYQSNDCSGAHTSFAIAAGGSCVPTADGSMRVLCSTMAVSEPSFTWTNTTIFLFIVLPTAAGLCLLCSVICCLYHLCCLRKDKADRGRNVRAQRAEEPVLQLSAVTAEEPAAQPPLPLMTSIA